MASRMPSLLPREHGAYAQVAFPLLTALALGRPGPAALLFIVAVVAVFLAHEPLLVLLGARGGRAKRETGPLARRRLAMLVGIGLPAGLLALALATPATRLAGLIPVALGTLLAPLIFSRREKTATGELLVAVTLAATMIPVAAAAGVSLVAASAAATVWAVAFALGTVTVRGIIARAKKNAETGWLHLVAPVSSTAVIGLAALLASSDRVPGLAAAAVVPTALVALIFGLMGIHPRNLRRMGWSLVASNVAVLAALVIGLR